MVRARVYLPPKPGRLRVDLPYPHDDQWGEWLRGMCGAGTRPFPVARPPWRLVWTVARSHFEALMRGLARRFGRVAVTTETRSAELCTASCQGAEVIGPEDCECVCLGRFHAGRSGSGQGWVNVSGELLVARQVVRRRFEMVHRWAEPWPRFEGDVFEIVGRFA